MLYGFLLCYYILTPFSQWAELGPKSAFWQPIWLLSRCTFPSSTLTDFTLEIAWKISLLMACVGLLTRWATPIAFILALYLVGLTLNHGKVYHMTMPMVVTLAIMAFSRCGDALRSIAGSHVAGDARRTSERRVSLAGADGLRGIPKPSDSNPAAISGRESSCS